MFVSPPCLMTDSRLTERQRVWFYVFQQPVVMTTLVVLQEITQAAGKYCATSNKPYFAHVWASHLSAYAGIAAQEPRVNN